MGSYGVLLSALLLLNPAGAEKVGTLQSLSSGYFLAVFENDGVLVAGLHKTDAGKLKI